MNRFTLVRSADSSYTELSSFAARLGLAVHKPLSFTVSNGTSEVTVALETNSGTVTDVLVTVAFGPVSLSQPFLIMRPETPVDVSDKASGLSREVQLGHAAFDAAVYIDSNAADDEVKRFLQREGTRNLVHGVLAAGAEAVTWQHGKLVVRVPKKAATDHALQTALDTVLSLSQLGIAPRGPIQARRGAWLTWVLGLGLPLSIVGLMAAHAAFGIGFRLLGLAVSIGVMSFAGAPAIRSVVAGDSGSGGRFRMLLALYVIQSAAGGSALLMALNAALGSGEVTSITGHVTRVERDEDDAFSTTIAWDDGSESVDTLDGELVSGTSATRTIRAGLFTPWGRKVTAP